MSVRRLTASIRSPKNPGKPALMPYLVSGYPTRAGFSDLLRQAGAVADAIEVGVPFSDPMADGPVIQVASRQALDNGVNLTWILDQLRKAGDVGAPTVLMSYVNPLLAYGLDRVVEDASEAGASGFIVPDLPFAESGAFREACASHEMALIQLVTPVTPADRLAKLCAASTGFVYAVTIAGITGATSLPAELMGYLDRVRAVSPVPVCAGFGIRTARDMERLRGHADGAIVGTRVIEAIRDGEDLGEVLRGLR